MPGAPSSPDATTTVLPKRPIAASSVFVVLTYSAEYPASWFCHDKEKTDAFGAVPFSMPIANS